MEYLGAAAFVCVVGLIVFGIWKTKGKKANVKNVVEFPGEKQ